MAHIDKLVNALQRKLPAIEARLTKFKTTVAEHPVYAFEWAEADMCAAAEQRVFNTVIDALCDADSRADFDSMKKHAMRQLVNMSQNAERSTSVCSNSMKRFELAAWGYVVEKMMDLETYGDTM